MDDIHIVPYNPLWSQRFEDEKRRVLEALNNGLIKRIEHFGSTAVPNLPAKPIIDILIGVEHLGEALSKVVPVLETMGYSYWADNPRKDVLFLVKGLPPNGPRTHHIHIAELDHETWERLRFRDYLRVHAEEAQNYAKLKHDLASKFATDREAYTAAKTEYIRQVMVKAKQEKGE